MVLFYFSTSTAAPLPAAWPPVPSWSSLDQQWTADLHELWLRAESGVAFCFGSSERSVLKLLQASFPLPLPLGPPEDAFCSNATKVTARLCRTPEIEHYYKVLPSPLTRAPLETGALDSRSFQAHKDMVTCSIC